MHRDGTRNDCSLQIGESKTKKKKHKKEPGNTTSPGMSIPYFIDAHMVSPRLKPRSSYSMFNAQCTHEFTRMPVASKNIS